MSVRAVRRLLLGFVAGGAAGWLYGLLRSPARPAPEPLASDVAPAGSSSTPEPAPVVVPDPAEPATDDAAPAPKKRAAPRKKPAAAASVEAAETLKAATKRARAKLTDAPGDDPGDATA